MSMSPGLDAGQNEAAVDDDVEVRESSDSDRDAKGNGDK